MGLTLLSDVCAEKIFLDDWTFFFSDMTQRIESFVFWKNYSSKWALKVWLKELNLFLHDSQNWTSLFPRNTQRIELFKLLIEFEPLFMNLFSIWLKELKSFFYLTQRIEPFLCSNMSQRIEPPFMNLFSIWLKELKSFFYMTQKLSLLFWIRLKESNPFLNVTLKKKIKILNSFQKIMTQRIEPFFLEMNDSKKRTSLSYELLFYMTQRIEPSFLNTTQRIKPIFECDS